MLIRLQGGRIVDPAHDRDGIGDVWIRDGRIAVRPPPGDEPDAVYDVSGRIVMAGGIDIHSHIAGGNVNIARLLLPELRAGEVSGPPEAPFATARWSAAETGRLYAEMGFTTVVEPAVAPTLALRTHLELDDIPIIDRAGLVVLGSDDFFLDLLRAADGATVLIEVGVPGRDHDAVLTSPRSGALAHVAAAERSNLPTVAEVLERIEARLAPVSPTAPVSPC